MMYELDDPPAPYHKSWQEFKDNFINKAKVGDSCFFAGTEHTSTPLWIPARNLTNAFVSLTDTDKIKIGRINKIHQYGSIVQYHIDSTYYSPSVKTLTGIAILNIDPSIYDKQELTKNQLAHLPVLFNADKKTKIDSSIAYEITFNVNKGQTIPDIVLNELIDKGEKYIRRNLLSWPFGKTLSYRVDYFQNTIQWYWSDSK